MLEGGLGSPFFAFRNELMIPDDLIKIGLIGQTHALKGAFKIRAVDDPNQILKLMRVYVATRGWFVVKKLELHDTTPILQLVGISSLELATKLIGLELYAHEAELPLEEDAFYYHDLVGCKVIDQNKLEVGVVKDVLDTGIQDLLVIEKGGKDYLVPVQAPYVRVLRKLIEIDVFPGLLDDNDS
jgi:16S rRNA processing protein RimM